MEKKIKRKQAKDKSPRLSKATLLDDLRQICKKSVEQNYLIGANDFFALGYLAATYNLKWLSHNSEQLLLACKEYDKTDDLGLLDTIGETLIDLGIIVNDGRL